MLKRLSNLSEQRVHDEIVDTAVNYRGQIYRKVRIADVIDITQLRSKTLGTYALQAHFDFCICDDQHNPAFAIEFDGAGHNSKDDYKKNIIAQEADLALFRIDERLLNRSQQGITFLQYLVHTYFMGQAFHSMQMQGHVDPSEPFMMSAFIKPDAKHIFDSDFDFTTPARTRLNKLMRKQFARDERLPHLKMTGVLFGKTDSSFVGFASIPFRGDFIYARSKLDIGTPCLGRLGELPFGWSALGDYCEGMTIEALSDELEMLLDGGGHMVRTRHDVECEIAWLKASRYKPLRGFSGLDKWLIDQAFPKK